MQLFKSHTLICWIVLLSVCWTSPLYSQAQKKQGTSHKTPVNKNKLPNNKSKDSLVKKDSLCKKDTVVPQAAQTPAPVVQKKSDIPERKRVVHFYNEILFYWICMLCFLLGMVKTFFPRYSENLIKVMLNATLRQSQLIEQLIQARRPTFYMNFLIVLSAGTLLMMYVLKNTGQSFTIKTLLLSIGFITAIFLVKTTCITLLGWLTGNQREAKDYLFLVWLTNKALGVLCIPFICLIAFGGAAVAQVAVYISLASVVVLYLVRFLRVYNTVKYTIRVSQWHMFLYVLTMELLPIGLLYKTAAEFVFKM